MLEVRDPADVRSVDVHHPFGGFRDSGSAFKEQGSPGLRFYTRIKTSAVRFAW
jgi:acyl-CoA reductase-like NAD-dependent aldehyde dehydrogenase